MDTPALFTQVSTSPYFSVAAPSMLSWSAATPTSACTASASPPSALMLSTISSSACWLRQASTTLAPWRAAMRAVARPMPLLAPVMTMTWSCSFFNRTVMLISRVGCGRRPARAGWAAPGQRTSQVGFKVAAPLRRHVASKPHAHRAVMQPERVRRVGRTHEACPVAVEHMARGVAGRADVDDHAAVGKQRDCLAVAHMPGETHGGARDQGDLHRPEQRHQPQPAPAERQADHQHQAGRDGHALQEFPWHDAAVALERPASFD